jgi:hypothetical protein
MVITFPELPEVNPISVLLITVDPRYPSRWREEPYHSDINGFSQSGLSGANPGKLYYQTQVRCGGEAWLILPDEEVRAPDPRFIRTIRVHNSRSATLSMLIEYIVDKWLSICDYY